MKIGFIGTGAIAEAIVHGFCTCKRPPATICVSQRNQTRSRRLASRYSRVTIGSDNQSVIDQSDWIFITLTPAIATEVIPELRFRDQQTVINCVSTLTFARARTLISANVRLFKAIPLPAIAQQLGPIAYSPPDPRLAELFNRVGKVVEAKNEAQLQLLATITSQIASYFALQVRLQQWLAQTVLPKGNRSLTALAGKTQCSGSTTERAAKKNVRL